MTRLLPTLVLALALAGCGHAPQPVSATTAALEADAASPRVTIPAASQTATQVTLRYQVKRSTKVATHDVALTVQDSGGKPRFVSGTVDGAPITAAMVRSAEGQQVVRELAAIGQAKGGGYRVQVVGIIVAVAGGVAVGAVLGAGLIIKSIIDALKPCSEGGMLC